MSHELTLCKSGCYIDDQCMNHVMYADDICLMAPNAIGLQKMLDVCFDLCLKNNVMFHHVKSVCVIFKPKNSKLSCPSVRLNSNIFKTLVKPNIYLLCLTRMLKMMKICSDKCVH